MQLLGHISPGVIITPGFFTYLLILSFGAVIGILSFNRLSKPFRTLTQMLCFIILVEILSKIFQNRWGTNFPIYHVSQIIQLVFFGRIFCLLLIRHQKTQIILVLSAVLCTVLSLLVTLFYQSIYTFPSIGSLLLSFYVSFSSVVLYYSMIKLPIITPVLKQPKFWFGAGSLFFYTITFFILGFFKLVLELEGKMPEWCYFILHLANYILYSSYLIAIILAARTNHLNK